MIGYIYNDEDNAPMNDDPFLGPHNPTVYTSLEEMKYVESGQRERDMEAKEASARKRHEDAIEGILDQLGLEGKCRKCDWIQELTDGFLTDDDKIFNSQFDFLKTLCQICDHGKHLDRVEKEWNDRCDFTKGLYLRFSCNWCYVPYEVYGQHKDPDDDWKDIEGRCGNCRYFQEEEEPLPFTEKLTKEEIEREENENESI